MKSFIVLTLFALAGTVFAGEITCKDSKQQVWLKFESPVNQDYREPVLITDLAGTFPQETQAFVQDRTPDFVRLVGQLNEYDHYVLELNFDQPVPSDNPWSSESGFSGSYQSDIFPNGFEVKCFNYSELEG